MSTDKTITYGHSDRFMAKSLQMPKRRSAAAERPARPPPPEKGKSAAQPRGARRKRETREKLLRAAFELMAERGADAVAINEITTAADVGFGSFYNHFQSKSEIHDAVLRTAFDQLGMVLDKVTVGIHDPAEVVAVSARHTILLAAKQPLWGCLLLREWHRPEAFMIGLGPRLLRDITSGIAAKRFSVDDPLMALVMAGGTLVAAIALQVALRGVGAELVDKFGLSAVDLDRRTVATLLQGLGMTAAEAHAIAAKPLLALDWAPSFAQSEAV